MKRIITFTVRFIVFWLVVFFINRLIFLISAISFIKGVSFFHASGALLSGWALDISTIGYLLPIPAFFISMAVIFRSRVSARIGDVFSFLFIVICCLTSFGELLLYREWMTKLTMQALIHFENPGEVFSTSPLQTTVIFFLMSAAVSFIYIYGYRKWVSLKAEEFSEGLPAGKKRLTAFLCLALLAPVNFLMIRGGWKAIPISDSDAYYSHNPVLNDAAVNPIWNLAHNILEYNSHQKNNPYAFMSSEEAATGLSRMFHAPDSTATILSTSKPNIVFIILEGITAYAVKNFGGDDIAPYLDSLSRNGVAFTKCFAAAYTSDQGIPAILSAYPSTPKISITNQSSKTKNLPCISRDLKNSGYESGFIFGGQLNYGNIRSYLYNTGFDVVLERNDFPESVPEGYLGIHDREMAPLVIEKINQAKPPFAYAWFTVSSHSPYDIPEPMQKLTETSQNKYLNTIAYTDKAVRDFFGLAKKQRWYSNTLFVVISDHSHMCQREFSLSDKENHRIVFFLYGDVIEPTHRGQKVDKLCCQTDVVPTILKQLGISSEQYVFGKNMLNVHAPSFSYYDFHNGSGMITDSCFIARRHKSDELLMTGCRDSTQILAVKKQHEMFVQKVYEDYLSR